MPAPLLPLEVTMVFLLGYVLYQPFGEQLKKYPPLCGNIMHLHRRYRGR